MRVINYERETVDRILNEMEYRTIVKRGYRSKSKSYIDLPCGFDIETTNLDEYKIGVMYEWTFGIKDLIIIGRRWEEFRELVGILYKAFNLSKNILVCYIHNLSFEFQFMRKMFEWVDVFSVDSRTPIKAVTTNNIEFRDSVILSGTDLRTVANNLTKHKVKKLNTLDYGKVRNSKTPLTEAEIQYCINDVLIILYYIEEQIEIYGNIANIPMTNTGRVRTYCQDKCLRTVNKKGEPCRDMNYVEKVQYLTLTEEIYEWTKKAFRGGFVHANLYNTDEVIENVDSWDEMSAYIWALCTQKYPITNFVKVENIDRYKFNYYINNRACLFKATFYGLEIKEDAPDAYISHIPNKMTAKGYELDNGRIRKADVITMYMTEVDYNIIKKIYNFDKVCCDSMYIAFKDYLPKKLIECALHLYKGKTLLKGTDELTNYRLYKDMCNAVYGMIVQDNIGKGEYKYNGEWSHNETNEAVEIDKYNKASNRFTWYCWGLWITAYCRERVWDAIINVGKDDQVYSDTDCVKCLNGDLHKAYFEESNNKVAEQIKAVSDKYNLDINDFYPVNKYGEVKMLGAWEYEGRSNKFKTLGAKQYLYMKEIEYGKGKVCPIKFINKHGRFNGDKFEEYTLTCSGVTKKAVRYLLTKDDPFDAFGDNMVIPAEYTGKLASVYTDSYKSIEVVDYLGNKDTCEELSSIYLMPVEFSLEEGDEFIEWLRGEMFNV